MPYYDSLFSRLSIDHHQDQKIEEVRGEVADAMLFAAPRQALERLAARVDQLELINRALVELLLAKGVVDEAELSVMAQQVDLLDGVEDGRISAEVHAGAPSCGACGRYVNPRRDACVYCGAAIARDRPKPPPVRTVDCVGCGDTVPERSTYYSQRGVVCERCFAMADG